MELHDGLTDGTGTPPRTDLIERYCAEQASAEDAAVLEAWFRAHPEYQTRIDNVKAALRHVDMAPATASEVAEVCAVILCQQSNSQIAGRPRGVGQGSVGRRPRYHWPILAVLGVVAAWFAIRTPKSPERWVDYVAKPGQQRTVTFADGTRIRLAPASRVRVITGFDRSRRRVDLTGEAFFDVHAAADAPFAVRTGVVTTTVLGTTFAVRAWPGGPVDVHVDEGRVRVRTRRATAVVEAGAGAHVTDSTAVVLTARGATQYTDWQRGQLVFKATPVPDVLATVGKWYGYQFQLNDSMLVKRRVSATFTIGDSAEMMTLLKYVLDVDLHFDGTRITLIRRTDHHAAPKASARQFLTPSVEIGK